MFKDHGHGYGFGWGYPSPIRAPQIRPCRRHQRLQRRREFLSGRRSVHRRARQYPSPRRCRRSPAISRRSPSALKTRHRRSCSMRRCSPIMSAPTGFQPAALCTSRKMAHGSLPRPAITAAGIARDGRQDFRRPAGRLGVALRRRWRRTSAKRPVPSRWCGD